MQGLDIIRWAVVVLLGLLGVYIVVMNYVIFCLDLFRRKHHSLFGLFGGGFCALALLACPVRAVHKWVWVPLVLDLGCLYIFVMLLYAIFVQKAFRS